MIFDNIRYYEDDGSAARYLLQPSNKELYDRYRDLFLYIYNSSIEEMAETCPKKPHRYLR